MRKQNRHGRAVSPQSSLKNVRKRGQRNLLEGLEIRSLMSSVSLNDGVVNIVGDHEAENSVVVSADAAKTQIYVRANGDSVNYNYAQVKSIHITGGLKTDTIDVRSSIDLTTFIDSSRGTDYISGGAGNDFIFAGGGVKTLFGNGGNDVIIGGPGDETLVGGDGNDSIYGSGGSDFMLGDAGNDLLDGGTGSNRGDGGAGTDTASNLNKSSANIEINTATGNTPSGVTPFQLTNSVLIVTGESALSNVLSVAPSTDLNYIVVSNSSFSASYPLSAVKSVRMVGGTQSDYLFISTALTLPSSIDGGAGNDVIISGNGADSITAGDGDDRIYSGGSADTIIAGAGNDSASAGSGNDSIQGNDGNDSLSGDADNDTLDGGNGTDTLDGGVGTDVGMNGETRANIESTTTTTGGGTTGTGGGTTTGTGGGTTTTGGGSIPSNSTAVAPTPLIVALATTVSAGNAIHVNAMSSTLGAGTPLTARYEWDFGDATGKYNKLVGYNAAHIYDTPGTYTISLRIYNEARGTAMRTMTVTITPAARGAIYISPTGNDANDGSTTATAVRTVARADALLAKRPNIDVLFQRGATYDFYDTLALRNNNIRVSAYGTGNNPVLRWAGGLTVATMIRCEATTQQSIIENLTFDSIYNGTDGNREGMPFAIKPNNTQIAIRNNTFLNVGMAVQTNGRPTGILIQDNNCPLITGVRNYFVWGEGSDFTVLGNTVVNTTREHTIRLKGVDRILVAYNDLNNIDRTSVDSLDIAKSSLAIQKGSYAWVTNNTIRGNWSVGPLGGADGLTDTGARWNYAVIENNLSTTTTLFVNHGAQHVMIRNNIMQAKDGIAIQVQGYNTQYNRQVSDLTIVNNTGINDGTQGRFLNVEGYVDGITLTGNLYKSDNMFVGSYGTSAVFINDSSLRSFRTIANNVWPTPTVSLWIKVNIGYAVNILGSNMSNLGVYLDPTEWNGFSQVQTDYFEDTAVSATYAPVSTSTAYRLLAPTVPGVFVDYYGNVRPVGVNWTAGAVQA